MAISLVLITSGLMLIVVADHFLASSSTEHSVFLLKTHRELGT